MRRCAGWSTRRAGVKGGGVGRKSEEGVEFPSPSPSDVVYPQLGQVFRVEFDDRCQCGGERLPVQNASRASGCRRQEQRAQVYVLFRAVPQDDEVPTRLQEVELKNGLRGARMQGCQLEQPGGGHLHPACL